MAIGDNIKTLREARGLTQLELSEKLGVSRGAVSQWELGIVAPRMGTIEQMAAFFGVKKSDIIEDRHAPDIMDDRKHRVMEAAKLFDGLNAEQQKVVVQLMRVMQS